MKTLLHIRQLNDCFGMEAGFPPGPFGPVAGAGTLNYIAKWTPDGSTIGDSLLFDNGVSVGFGTVVPNASATLDLTSVTKGFLAPRMTTAQRNAIGAPAIGLFIYNISTSVFCYWDGVKWVDIESSATSEWQLGGNTVGLLQYIGTNDNFDFPFYTNGTEKMRLLNTGELCLGTTTSSGQYICAKKDQDTFTNGFIQNSSVTANATAAWVAASDTVITFLGAGSSVNTSIPNTGAAGTVSSNFALIAGQFAPADMIFYTSGIAPANERMRLTSTGNFGIGTSAPFTKLEVAANNASAAILSTRYSSDTGTPGFIGRKGRGTQAAPVAILAGDSIGGFGGSGYTSGGAFSNVTGQGVFMAAENFTAIAQGTNWQLQLTPIGSIVIAPIVTVRNDGFMTLLDMNIGRGNNLIATNTVMGVSSLAVNSTGAQSSAFGQFSLMSNTTGSFNSAFGVSAMNNNTTGQVNSAFGLSAMYFNITGNNNAAFGSSALQNNTAGIDNAAFGTFALINTLGSLNTAIGHNAGQTNTVGNNNLFLGGTSDASVNNLTNATAIGYAAIIGASNAMRLGAGADVGVDIAIPLAKFHVFGVNVNGINQRLEPVAEVTQDTTGAKVSTIDAVVTILQTIATTTDTVKTIHSIVKYRKTGGVGVGAIGDGTSFILTVTVSNIGGVVSFTGAIQNDYTGTIIAGFNATYAISGTNVLLNINGAINDNVDWTVITKTY